MPFINTIATEDATGSVYEMYARQQGDGDTVPGYARVFSHRPALMSAWADLQRTIKKAMDHRCYELATLSAAIALGSTNCSLAHAGLLSRYYPLADIEKIVAGNGVAAGVLTPAEQALWEFAAKVARSASAVTASDVDVMRGHGFGDADVFDIASAAAARAFFTKLVDSLGSEADHGFEAMPGSLREALSVGRPIAIAPKSSVADRDWLYYSS